MLQVFKSETLAFHVTSRCFQNMFENPIARQMSDVKCRKISGALQCPSVNRSFRYKCNCTSYGPRKEISDIFKTRFMRGNKFQGTQQSMILLQCNFVENLFLVFNTFQGEKCLSAHCSSGDATTFITMLFCVQ